MVCSLRKASRPRPGRGDTDPFSSTAFADHGISDRPCWCPGRPAPSKMAPSACPWTRAPQAAQELWAKDKYMKPPGRPGCHALMHFFFDFATVAAQPRSDPPGRIRQLHDRPVVGTIAVDRDQPWGAGAPGRSPPWRDPGRDVAAGQRQAVLGLHHVDRQRDRRSWRRGDGRHDDGATGWRQPDRACCAQDVPAVARPSARDCPTGAKNGPTTPRPPWNATRPASSSTICCG